MTVRSYYLCRCAETVMNLTVEMRERLKAVAVETTQLQADIVALGGTPVEPATPLEPAAGATASVKRPSSEITAAADGGDAMDVEVKAEPTGRGKRKSKGRKR